MLRNLVALGIRKLKSVIDKTSLIIAGTSILFLLLYIFFVAPHIAINFSPSINGHVFWIKRNTSSLSRGDYVLIKISPERNDPYIKNGYVGKRICCLSGETLERKDLAFYCEGELIAVAKTHSLSGKPLRPFDWTRGKIPEGHYFVCGDHPYSWDSRYYGFVSEKEIVAKEVKLF